jgi:hypothetical protein
VTDFGGIIPQQGAVALPYLSIQRRISRTGSRNGLFFQHSSAQRCA